MKTLLLFLTLFLLPLAEAVDLSYHGYYRTRGDYFKHLDLHSGQSRMYWDQRFRLDTDLRVDDYIHLFAQVDVLDNAVYGGNPASLETATNPASFTTDQDPYGNDVVVPSQDPKSEGNFFSQGQRPAYLRVKRVWAEVFANLGYLKIGRQPSHFGLGLYENRGDGLDDDFGDSVDRISFASRLDNVSAELGYDKEVEIDPLFDVPATRYGIDNNGEDVTRYFARVGYVTDRYDLQALLSRRKRHGTSPDLVVWSYDLYGKYRLGWLLAETEFLSFQGDGGDDHLDVSTYASVLRLTAGQGKYRGLLEGGLASGTEETTLHKDRLHGVPFDRDYNLSMLLFEEVLPGGSGKDLAGGQAVGSAPSSGGAVSNAIYARTSQQFLPLPSITLAANLLLAWAHREPLLGLDQATAVYATERFYGFEWGLSFRHELGKPLLYGLDFAHFVPLDVFDQQQDLLDPGHDARSAYTLQAFFGVRF
ncbi:MAG: hypothetical protein A2284_11215 [Deltaproteobacteria bacterium RIFOXYA12_FULL_61_11]|nr:MAG: hypothetical protein A2284_11215 [Deltaproteobacteria bacterium RIFOXYA12_FULL_61_11]